MQKLFDLVDFEVNCLVLKIYCVIFGNLDKMLCCLGLSLVNEFLVFDWFW